MQKRLQKDIDDVVFESLLSSSYYVDIKDAPDNMFVLKLLEKVYKLQPVHSTKLFNYFICWTNMVLTRLLYVRDTYSEDFGYRFTENYEYLLKDRFKAFGQPKLGKVYRQSLQEYYTRILILFCA